MGKKSCEKRVRLEEGREREKGRRIRKKEETAARHRHAHKQAQVQQVRYRQSARPDTHTHTPGRKIDGMDNNTNEKAAPGRAEAEWREMAGGGRAVPFVKKERE